VNQAGIPIARLLGIEIRVSLVWAPVLAIVTMLGVEQAALTSPALDPLIEWLLGASGAALFLVSVIAHELSHAVVGRHRGVPATSVVLGFFGSLAPLSIRAATPRDELAISLAGPAMSWALAVAFSALGLAVAAAFPGLEAVAGGLVVVGVLNLALGVINLVPAMPLDGGRAVRAVAWARTHDPDRAGLVAAQVGRMVGWLVIGVGIAAALAALVTEGLVLLALGWMLTTGGRTLERRTNMERLLRGMHVEDAMDRDVGWIGPQLTVDTFADRFEGPDRLPALPVVDGEQVVGVVGRRGLLRLGRRRFGGTRAGEVMGSPPQVPLLAPDDPLWDALELLSAGTIDGLAVADHGRLAGLLTRDGVAEAIRSRAALQAAGHRGGGGGGA
jgi:Zn-dependent protease/predicted transcriptional regulator